MTEPLRVLTWNVRDLLGDPLAVARVLRASRADVVCLQEAPRWPGSRWRVARLAREAGLLYVAGGRVSAGTALLCSLRAEVADVVEARLPVQGRRTRPRGAVFGTVRLPGHQSVALACVHLGLTAQERERHVRLIRSRLVASARPVLVAGDLNEAPGGPSWVALGDLVVDPAAGSTATFPARAPRRRIDAVLASPGLEVVSYGAWVPDEADVRSGSDHLPVLAEIALPRQATAAP